MLITALQPMEHRLPIPEGANMAENILQHPANFKRILSHPVTAMGIRANRNDLATQLLKPL